VSAAPATGCVPASTLTVAVTVAVPHATCPAFDEPSLAQSYDMTAILTAVADQLDVTRADARLVDTTCNDTVAASPQQRRLSGPGDVSVTMHVAVSNLAGYRIAVVAARAQALSTVLPSVTINGVAYAVIATVLVDIASTKCPFPCTACLRADAVSCVACAGDFFPNGDVSGRAVTTSGVACLPAGTSSKSDGGGSGPSGSMKIVLAVGLTLTVLALVAATAVVVVATRRRRRSQAEAASTLAPGRDADGTRQRRARAQLMQQQATAKPAVTPVRPLLPSVVAVGSMVDGDAQPSTPQQQQQQQQAATPARDIFRDSVVTSSHAGGSRVVGSGDVVINMVGGVTVDHRNRGTPTAAASGDADSAGSPMWSAPVWRDAHSSPRTILPASVAAKRFGGKLGHPGVAASAAWDRASNSTSSGSGSAGGRGVDGGAGDVALQSLTTTPGGAHGTRRLLPHSIIDSVSSSHAFYDAEAPIARVRPPPSMTLLPQRRDTVDASAAAETMMMTAASSPRVIGRSVSALSMPVLSPPRAPFYLPSHSPTAVAAAGTLALSPQAAATPQQHMRVGHAVTGVRDGPHVTVPVTAVPLTRAVMLSTGSPARVVVPGAVPVRVMAERASAVAASSAAGGTASGSRGSASASSGSGALSAVPAAALDFAVNSVTTGSSYSDGESDTGTSGLAGNGTDIFGDVVGAKPLSARAKRNRAKRTLVKLGRRKTTGSSGGGSGSAHREPHEAAPDMSMEF
jgi:hypothetical protein